MAVGTMDPLPSFSYLTDNIPRWMTSIDAISSHAAQKHTEFVADYERLVKQHIKPKRPRSTSLNSIHTNDSLIDLSRADHATDTEHQPPPHLDAVEINPLVAGNRYLYAQAQKKRKTEASEVKSGASGPQKFRTKQALVIYYDSHLQRELETVVKNLGAARNNLRKGKQSLTLAKGLQLPSLTRRFETTYASTSLESLTSTIMSKPTYRMALGKVNSINIAPNTPDDEAAFIKADKELELTQHLCETAAHQFLRDGDCQLELENTTQKLRSVLELAKATVELLKVNANKEEEPVTDDATVAQPASDIALAESSLPDFVLPTLPKRAPTINDTLAEMKARPFVPTAVAANPVVADIEVDDDDDQSSIDVDITRFRAMNAARRVRA